MSLFQKTNQQTKNKKHRPPSKKRQIIFWGGLFCFSVLLNMLARQMPGFAEWYAVNVYPLWVGSLGRACSWLPVSLAELLVLVGASGFLIWTVFAGFFLARRRDESRFFWFKSAAFLGKLAVLLFLLFTVNCGINYHRLTFSQREGFQMEKSTVEELEALCMELTAEVNEAAAQIEIDEQGAGMIRERVEERAVKAMEAASHSYEELSGYYPKAKAVRNSWILSYQQLEGIYSPFTIEANYNGDMPAYKKPATICHELSHLQGFMREDEANFIAYLACRASSDPDFWYSGSMMAYVYSTNALYRADRERYWNVREELCDQANRDLKLYNEFWDGYEGKVAEVSEKVNDTYLKANAQTEGTRSYGRMVDLLLALRRQKMMEE